VDRNEPASIVCVRRPPPECNVLVLLKRLLPSFRLTGILCVYSATLDQLFVNFDCSSERDLRTERVPEKKEMRPGYHVNIACKSWPKRDEMREGKWKWESGFDKRRAQLSRARESRG
jgi:hypothetical protein